MNQSNITYVYHAQSGVQRLIFSALERVMQDLSYRTLIWAELRSKPQDKKFFKIFEGRQNLFKSVFAWRWPIFTWNVRSIKSGKISDFGTKPVNMGRVWSKPNHTYKDNFKTYSMCGSTQLATEHEGNILTPRI